MLNLGVQNKHTQKYKDLAPHFRRIAANKARHQTSHKLLHLVQYRGTKVKPHNNSKATVSEANHILSFAIFFAFTQH